MIFYNTSKGRIYTTREISTNYGEQVLNWDYSRQNSVGLYQVIPNPKDSDFNPFTHAYDSSGKDTFTFWSNESDFRAVYIGYDYDRSTGDDSGRANFPLYVQRRTIVALADSDLTEATRDAKDVVADELENRRDVVDTFITTAARAGYNLSTKMDSYRTALDAITSDSDYPTLFAHPDPAVNSRWPTLPSYDSAFDSTNLTLPFDAYTKAQTDSQITSTVDSAYVNQRVEPQLVQVYASWDGSAGGGYTWASNQLSSFGVDSVSRVQEGSFRVHFTSPFSDSNYAVTTGIGADRYGGAGASPRQLTVVRAEMTPDYVTVHCERTDDAVDEDNEYFSVVIMGTR